MAIGDGRVSTVRVAIVIYGEIRRYVIGCNYLKDNGVTKIYLSEKRQDRGTLS